MDHDASFTKDGQPHEAAYSMREVRRKLIESELGRNPGRSDRAIAKAVSCDHKTVARVRRQLSREAAFAEAYEQVLAEDAELRNGSGGSASDEALTDDFVRANRADEIVAELGLRPGPRSYFPVMLDDDLDRYVRAVAKRDSITRGEVVRRALVLHARNVQQLK
jgi:hypothetical protein